MPMTRTAWLILMPAILLAGCAGKDAGSTAAGLTTPFIQTEDVKQAAAETVAPENRSSAMGVVMNIGGPQETVRTQLGVGVVLLGAIPAPQTQRYVEAIRDRLLGAWPYPMRIPTPKVEIMCNTEYGAEALADDTIQIPIGVIAQAETQDEVAFVVGHELGHLLMQHEARRRKELNNADTGIKAMSVIAMVGAMFATGHRVGNTVIVNPGSVGTIVASTSGGQMAGAEVLTTLVDPGWSRRQEEQADLIGIDLMTGAGYNPELADQAFDTLLREEADGERRAAEAKQQAADQPKPASTPGSLGDFLGALLSPIGEGLHSLRVNHPDTSSRAATVVTYEHHFYADALARKSDEASQKRIKSSTEFRKVQAAVADITKADEDLGDHQPAQAATDAIAAERLLPGWWGPSYVAGLAYIEAGQTQQGIAQLTRATDASGAPYPVYERTAYEIAATGNTAGAIAMLDKAALRFGGPDVTWLDRITIYSRAHDEAGVAAVRKACLQSDNIGMKEACDKTTISSQFSP